MKKNTKVTIAVALIGLVATAAVAFKYVNARTKIKELEAVSRLQNLTLIAIGNKIMSLLANHKLRQKNI